VNSTALNCSSCNAPLTPGALRCDYCGNATPAGIAAAARQRAVPVPPARPIAPPSPEPYAYVPSVRGPVEVRTFFPAILRCFAKYVGFGGRASLAEYWWWAVLNAAVFFGAVLIAGATPKSDVAGDVYAWWLLLTFLPGWAVTVRRLHDVRRSGWNALWWLTGIGALVVLYWVSLPSDAAPNNRWGPPNPI
jgi:uncharacterized membrane protein YhaH (DUF805 family)